MRASRLALRGLAPLMASALVLTLLALPASAEDAAIGATIEIDQSALTATLYNAQNDLRVSLAGTVRINTDGRHMVNLALTVEGTSWARDISPSSISRASDTDVRFTAWVDVPRQAAEGSYPLRVRATDGEPFPIDTHAAFTVSVFRGPLAIEAALASPLPHPGEAATWVLTLRNLATFDLDFDAAFQTPSGWGVRTAPPPVQVIAPGSRENVSLELRVPSTAPSGDYEWSVTVTSASHPEISATLSAPFEVIRPPPPPGSASPDFLAAYWLPITLGLAGFGLVAYFSLTEVGYLALSFALLVPLFTRLKRDRVLDNFTRGQIYGYIQANPGAHYSAIQEVLDIENGVLAYHLRVLLRENYLVARSEGIFKRFYPRDYKIPRGRTLLTRLQVDILEAAERTPGVSQREVARALGESKQVISYNVGVLRDALLLSTERRGRDVCLRASAPSPGGPAEPAPGTDAALLDPSSL